MTGQKGIPPPNYTQIPNALFDILPEMVEAELRITMAIARQTFGWHKEADRLSITRLQELTGLSRQGVINGLERGMKRGTIVRQVDGNTYRYSLNLAPDVHEVDTCTPSVQGSQPNGLGVVNEVDQSLVNEVDPQKKVVKENSFNNFGSSSGGDRPEAFRVYEQEIGALTAIAADLLKDDLNAYPEDWIIEAIRIAARQNKRSLAYAEGILKRWKNEGRGAGKPQPSTNGYNSTTPAVPVNTHQWDNYEGPSELSSDIPNF